jgi:hypothetical protein
VEIVVIDNGFCAVLQWCSWNPHFAENLRGERKYVPEICAYNQPTWALFNVQAAFQSP